MIQKQLATGQTAISENSQQTPGPFRSLQHTRDKMHTNIPLGLLWCAMCIFLFTKFYNFTKGIVRIYIVF